MQIDPMKNCNHLECIRCGRCEKACAAGALKSGFFIEGLKGRKDGAARSGVFGRTREGAEKS